MRRRALAAVAAVLAIAGVAFVAGRLLTGDEPAPDDAAGSTAATAAATAADLAALGPAGTELAALLRAGEHATYHARYRAQTGDDAAGGQEVRSEVRFEVWRLPPRQRQDTVLRAAGQAARTATFHLPSGVVSCTRTEPRPWECRRVQAPEPAGPAALIRQIAEQAAEQPADVRDATIAGEAVRCFAFALPAYGAEVCVTAAGVPARVRAGPATIELVELAVEFDADVFTPPARPR